MKIVDAAFEPALGALGAIGALGAHDEPRGRGWSVFVEALSVPARIGIYPHEHGSPQPLVIDAQLGYRCMPREKNATGEAGDWIDYDGYCTRLADFLGRKPHTRLLETLVADMAAFSFREWPALETLRLAVHKPKIRPGTRRVGVALDWTRADYRQWIRADGGGQP
ncbi:dihydroneopterin aldolase [Paraburkholderia sp. CNPSo 3281]|uniref:dihydroneopterin aldolase n=1 Tax=Paraburkholderia sp. CNPSo 3281 TaxID=2940933 RepID=UPI0020B87EDB|nr:dihydroneopterin aldolase [Paraburkholderia sp. CNPSo 3281]MCP3720227.1 dihydroneopterin aldolase [Paraburkholderia sp. CNPSo 3281]